MENSHGTKRRQLGPSFEAAPTPKDFRDCTKKDDQGPYSTEFIEWKGFFCPTLMYNSISKTDKLSCIGPVYTNAKHIYSWPEVALLGASDPDIISYTIYSKTCPAIVMK